MKHSKLPWKVEGVDTHDKTLVYCRIKSEGKSIAFAGVYKGVSAVANAEYIIEACNNYAALRSRVAELEEVLGIIRNYKNYATDGDLRADVVGEQMHVSDYAASVLDGEKAE